MKKKLLLILFIFSCFYCQVVIGQSSNFIAQGHYYKAKELFENKQYNDAIKYILNSKTNLQGTNYQLQYIHIMSLVAISDFIGAKNEMETYFQIVEKETLAKGFTKYVERLTDDETKALSKIMIDIMENAKKEESNLPVLRLNTLLNKAKGIYYNYEIVGFSSGYVLDASFYLDGDLVNYNAKYCTNLKELKSNFPYGYSVFFQNVNFRKYKNISISPQDYRKGDVCN